MVLYDFSVDLSVIEKEELTQSHTEGAQIITGITRN
jgi:hypothetical protein